MSMWAARWVCEVGGGGWGGGVGKQYLINCSSLPNSLDPQPSGTAGTGMIALPLNAIAKQKHKKTTTKVDQKVKFSDIQLRGEQTGKKEKGGG